MLDQVDVLIIGAGASGAAVAWSLAETKMHIVCLEQGGWMNPAEYPATRRDAEARNGDSFAINPNRRAGSADYPINEDNSPIKVANFNAVGGGTVRRTMTPIVGCTAEPPALVLSSRTFGRPITVSPSTRR